MANKQMTSGSKIVPHLWFDDQAVEAAEFYASVFPSSHVGDVTTMPADTPSGPEGSVVIVELTVFHQPFVAFNAGPLFKFNPSISFMVNFDARKKLDEVWEKLSDGGEALIPIDKYPFSERYGWIQDRYGVTWQLILRNPEAEPRPAIRPSLMFTNEKA